MNISIATKPAIYKIFRSLPNTHWNCISEFIDNSLSAWLNSPTDSNCLVIISIDKKQITIEDNGPGISAADFHRAFEPANTPINNASLNEFGMGLKTASLYLGNNYKVQTQRKDSLLHEIFFDLDVVTEFNLTELEVITNERDQNKLSFTKITISNLNSETAPDPVFDLEQIKYYLSKIYKKAISTYATIIVNGEKLKEKETNYLIAPWYQDFNSSQIIWHTTVNCEYQHFKIKGFVSLLSELSDFESGLLLFRRGRVVVGMKERCKPKILFSNPGSHLYKRLYGELELEGFNISMSKDKILEDSVLNIIFDKIKKFLDSQEMSLLEQGKEFRINKFNIFKNAENEQKNSKPLEIPQTLNTIKKDPELTTYHNGKKLVIIGEFKFHFIEGKKEGTLIQAITNENQITIRSDFFLLEARYKCAIELLRLFPDTKMPHEIIQKLDTIWQILGTY
jgi:hypothetical protein